MLLQMIQSINRRKTGYNIIILRNLLIYIIYTRGNPNVIVILVLVNTYFGNS